MGADPQEDKHFHKALALGGFCVIIEQKEGLLSTPPLTGPEGIYKSEDL